jgi:hypothetical protein
MTAHNRRQLLLAALTLAGLVLLVVGVMAVVPRLGGSDEAQPPLQFSASAGPATTTTIGPSTSAGSVKDPFRPLVSTGAAAAATESGATAGEAGSVTSSTLAATGSTVAGAGAGTATTPGGGTTAERQVALVSISGGTAKVTVDSRAYTVSEGETFASRYRATDINSECASFESGTTSFTLCEGEAVLK